MTIIGIYTNKENTTIYVSRDFDAYYTDHEQGRSAVGKAVQAIYVGHVDVSGLKPGMEIDIFYGAPVNGRNGVYAPVRRIEVLK